MNFIEIIQQTSKFIQAFHSLTANYGSIFYRNQRGKGNLPQYFKFSKTRETKKGIDRLNN